MDATSNVNFYKQAFKELPECIDETQEYTDFIDAINKSKAKTNKTVLACFAFIYWLIGLIKNLVFRTTTRVVYFTMNDEKFKFNTKYEHLLSDNCCYELITTAIGVKSLLKNITYSLAQKYVIPKYLYDSNCYFNEFILQLKSVEEVDESITNYRQQLINDKKMSIKYEINDKKLKEYYVQNVNEECFKQYIMKNQERLKRYIGKSCNIYKGKETTVINAFINSLNSENIEDSETNAYKIFKNNLLNTENQQEDMKNHRQKLIESKLLSEQYVISTESYDDIIRYYVNNILERELCEITEGKSYDTYKQSKNIVITLKYINEMLEEKQEVFILNTEPKEPNIVTTYKRDYIKKFKCCTNVCCYNLTKYNYNDIQGYSTLEQFAEFTGLDTTVFIPKGDDTKGFDVVYYGEEDNKKYIIYIQNKYRNKVTDADDGTNNFFEILELLKGQKINVLPIFMVKEKTSVPKTSKRWNDNIIVLRTSDVKVEQF